MYSMLMVNRNEIKLIMIGCNNVFVRPCTMDLDMLMQYPISEYVHKLLFFSDL